VSLCHRHSLPSTGYCTNSLSLRPSCIYVATANYIYIATAIATASFTSSQTNQKTTL
jgi:hypothetical protein